MSAMSPTIAGALSPVQHFAARPRSPSSHVAPTHPMAPPLTDDGNHRDSTAPARSPSETSDAYREEFSAIGRSSGSTASREKARANPTTSPRIVGTPHPSVPVGVTGEPTSSPTYSTISRCKG